MIVDSEDYLGVTGTYPEHPLSKNKVSVNTFTKLKEIRRADEKSNIKQKKDVKDSVITEMQKVKLKDYY